MIPVRIIPILLLIHTLYASSRVRGSAKFITQGTMTATMTSKHDYDVYDNPVDVVVTFSQETESQRPDIHTIWHSVLQQPPKRYPRMISCHERSLRSTDC